MNHKDISCPEMGVKIGALIDGELDQDEISRVYEHLNNCDQCSADYASLQKVMEVTKDMKFKKIIS